MKKLQDEIHAWANEVFPNRTMASALLKMYGEIAEVIENPSDPQEWADVGILLFDLAAMNGVDLETSMRHKHRINKNRKWKINPITGVMSHVKMTQALEVAYNTGVKDYEDGISSHPGRWDLCGEEVELYMQGYNNGGGEI